MSDLMAGCACGDITPEPGIHMGGYWGRRSGATDVHDRLGAKVLSFALEEERVALITFDLVGLDGATAGEIRRRVQEETGIPAEGIMVCCTHTHAGPLTVPFRGMGEVDVNYLARVKDTAVELARVAAGKMRAARVAYGKVGVQLGINRREGRREKTVIGQNSKGPVAPYAHLVRIDADDGLLATLFSHACHPVVLGRDNHSISADFAGAAARYVEAQTGAVALFVNGACGDVNPRKTDGSFDDVEELGGELGQVVVGGMEEAKEVKVHSLRHAFERVQLPLVELPPRLRAETEKLALQLKAELKGITGDGGDAWAQRVPQARLAWAQEMLELVRAGGGKNRFQSFAIQGIGLGELALLGMEGEIFARYQLDLEKRSPLPATMLCGYANGCIGYVPTAGEYALGGYEVEEAYKVYPSVQMIGPESEELIGEKARAILEGLVE